jgi:hypothetical protein
MPSPPDSPPDLFAYGEGGHVHFVPLRVTPFRMTRYCHAERSRGMTFTALSHFDYAQCDNFV